MSGGARNDLSLRFEEPASVAAARVLGRLLEAIEGNLDGACAGDDPEDLHHLRVAVRRSRSVQRQLRPVFEPVALERFRRDFRWVQQITGDARDLDVYTVEFDDFTALVPEPMRDDLDPLRRVLLARRRAARRRMVRSLHTQRAITLLEDWADWLGSPAAANADGGSAAGRPIGELAGERIDAVYRKMRRMGSRIDADSPAEAYHELRKKGKELRYLLELFGTPLYPAEVVKPMVKSLKSLQDVLGRHQDREVQQAMIRSLVSELAGHPHTLMAMGALVQRLGEDEQAARAEFAERFSAFASKSQRGLVDETFAP